jgi:transglutaminase-like putative cysteine protease
MKLLATHITRYWYSDSVSLCHTEVYLAPRARKSQTVLEHGLAVVPEPEAMYPREDYFGNPVTFFSIHEPHRELIVTSHSLVELAPSPPPNLNLSPPWEEVREAVHNDDARRTSPESFDASQFTFESPHIQVGPALAEYAAESFAPGRHFLDGVNDLSRRIYTDFEYDKRATTLATPVDEVLGSRRGVCQDFAHLMIACLRSLKLPARYVSGYVRTGHKFVGGEASHAWVSAWCPMFGWKDFDPTNNVMPQDRHITLAWGRDYSDVSPVKGVALGGGEQVISVQVDVTAQGLDSAV